MSSARARAAIMDVSLQTSTNLPRDALTTQSSAQAVAPPQATPLETPTAVLSPAQATLVRLLSDAVRSATALQGGLAALLPDLAKAQDMVVVPVAVRAAISTAMENLAPLQSLRSDADITAAFLKTEAPMPVSQAPASPSIPLPAPADIRASLQTLQQVLSQWDPEATQAQIQGGAPSTSQPAGVPLAVAVTAASPTPQTAAMPVPQSLAPSLGPEITPATTNQASTPASPQPAPPALLQQELPATPQTAPNLPLIAPAASAAPSPPPAELGDAMASLLLLQQSARSVAQAALRTRPTAARPEATSPARNEGGPDTGNPQQLPKSAARGLEPISPVTRWPANPDASFVARTLTSRTENALTQVKLLEVAHQMQRPDERQPTATAPEPRWTFDLPIQTPQGQSKARFEIERDTYKTQGGKDTRVWRARFSIDVEPLGPIHAQIAVMGKNAWVSILAERESTMRTLESQQQELLKGFGAEDIEAELICGLGKAAQRPTPHQSGKILDSVL